MLGLKGKGQLRENIREKKMQEMELTELTERKKITTGREDYVAESTIAGSASYVNQEQEDIERKVEAQRIGENDEPSRKRELQSKKVEAKAKKREQETDS